MIAEVVLNTNTKATDNIYHYVIPDVLIEYVKTGTRVYVPFGRGNKCKEAYVIGVVASSERSDLKEISDIVDEYVYFDNNAVELIKFMVHRYFCSYISAIKCIIPVGVGNSFKKDISLNLPLDEEQLNYIEHSVIASRIYSVLTEGNSTYDKLSELITSKNLTSVLSAMEKKGIIKIQESIIKGITDTIKKRICLNVEYEDAVTAVDAMQKRAPARARCLEALIDEGDMFLSELLETAQTSKSVVDYLESKGYVRTYTTIEREDILNIDYEHTLPRHQLNEYQKNVCTKVMAGIANKENNTYLLNGVTGSGKTEVYLELIENTLKENREAIFLVPEISLTPQMVRQVTARFGDRVAVIHSSLTQKQRYEQWKKINEGEVDVVVGARSAVFAPFKNPGLIIIDEEHENSYKSEFSPKYNTIEIAKFRAKQHNSVVLLASATPLVESTYKVEIGKYIPLSMPVRANNSALPDTFIVDMRKEMSDGNMSIFSRQLIEEIAYNLEKKEQTILFLNRRGFSSFVSCRNCGYVPKCPNCNLSLTYHKSINKMVCHYCDFAHKTYDVCPECNSKYIKHFGIGTERVVQEINEIFPGASVIRMDADTTMARQSHEKLLESFKNHEADILIGTQMITKGLDFENVTLVGIVAADMSLNVDDYRACERTFDLITQVTGRAGRGLKKGRAIIQTYNPDSETIQYASKQDYQSFYDEEIEIRKMLIYPPFCEFINFVFSDANINKAKNTAKQFCNALKYVLKDERVVFYPIGEAPLFKINNNYRFRFLIKTRYSKKMYEQINKLYRKYITQSNTRITIDVNPSNMN